MAQQPGGYPFQPPTGWPPQQQQQYAQQQFYPQQYAGQPHQPQAVAPHAWAAQGAWQQPGYPPAAQPVQQQAWQQPQQPPVAAGGGWAAAPPTAPQQQQPPQQPVQQPQPGAYSGQPGVQQQQQHAAPPLPQDAPPPLPPLPPAPPLPEGPPPLPPGPDPQQQQQQQQYQQQPMQQVQQAHYQPQQQYQQQPMQQAHYQQPPAQMQQPYQQPGYAQPQAQHAQYQPAQQYAAPAYGQQPQYGTAPAYGGAQAQQHPGYAQQAVAYGGWPYAQPPQQQWPGHAAAHYPPQQPMAAATGPLPTPGVPGHPAAVGAPPVAAPCPPAPAAAAAQPLPQPIVDALSLLSPGPGRSGRPKRIAVLLRGLPGSGKSHVARLIRDKEVAAGGEPPRILSLDDYFMTEVEKEVDDEEGGGGRKGGRKRKIEVLEYHYERDMEASYLRSLLRAFQRAAEEARFPFLIVDAPAIRVADFKDFWAAAQAAGYEAYVAEPPETDPQVCYDRCIHGRSKEEVYALSALFEPAPGWCTLLTLGRLLGKAGSSGPGGGSGGSTGAAGSDGIAEVDMDEDGGGGTPMAANGSGSGSGGAMRQGGSGEEDGEEEEAAGKAAQPGRSRWAAMDDSSEDEGTAAAAARKRKKLGGAGGSSGGLGVDDWRDLLASGKQALAGKTPGSAPRGILSRCSGGSNGNGSGRASAGKKRVRWPDEAPGAGEEEEQGFRIGGGGERAKAGLEVVHVLHGLGPPAQLEDGSAGVVPHPSANFAAAAKAEHTSEADLFKRLLLSRGSPH